LFGLISEVVFLGEEVIMFEDIVRRRLMGCLVKVEKGRFCVTVRKEKIGLGSLEVL
jgi:hypothetical protein